MALNISAFLMLVLAAKALKGFFSDAYSKAEKQKALYIAGGIVLSLLLGAVIFSSPTGLDPSLKTRIAEGLGMGSANSIDDALIADRKGLIKSDAFRSLLFVGLSFGLLFISLKKNSIKPLYAGIGVALLLSIDLIGVGSRAIDAGDFQSSSVLNTQFSQPKPVDEKILSDKDPHFRVLDLRSSPFSSASASYFHHSMGGYHAVKMMKIQEMVEFYLNDVQNSLPLYGMFNAKYIIQDNEQASVNPYALGNAWFVDNIKIVQNADEEMASLAGLDPKRTAVIQEKNAGDLKEWQPDVDPSAQIALSSYHPDEMVYTYSASSDQLAVFSEVYYPPSKGWTMYLDGEKFADYTQANFVLRALKLPAGQNRELKMVFHPRAYYTGELVAMICSIIILLSLGAGIYFNAKN